MSLHEVAGHGRKPRTGALQVGSWFRDVAGKLKKARGASWHRGDLCW